MTKRLPPMIDDPSQPPYVRELLQAGRDFQVRDYDVAKGLDKHLGHIAAGTPAPPWVQSLQAAQGAGAAAAAGGSLVPWIVLPIATATVVAAVMLGTTPQAPAPRPAVSAPLAAPQPAAPAVQAELEPRAAEAVTEPAADTRLPAEREERTARPAPRPERPAAVRAAKTTTGRAPTAADAPAPASGRPARGASAAAAASASPQASAEEHPPARAGEQPPATPEREAAITIDEPKPAAAEAAAAEPPARAEPSVQDDARLEREMAMLAMSQRVLHADPQRALKLAQQGEAEFSGSMFTQERQQLLLLALVKLGRIDDAKRLAKPYLARYPNGPFSDRVRRALATGKVER